MSLTIAETAELFQRAVSHGLTAKQLPRFKASVQALNNEDQCDLFDFVICDLNNRNHQCFSRVVHKDRLESFSGGPSYMITRIANDMTDQITGRKKWRKTHNHMKLYHVPTKPLR